MNVTGWPPQWILPQWPVAERVRAVSTTRQGGISEGIYNSFNIGAAVGDDPRHVAENRARLRRLLPSEPLWLQQVHGARVIASEHYIVGMQADASVARSPGAVLAVQSADCLPVLLAERRGAVIAAVHAGWRGLAEGVIENALCAMRVSASEVVAWLGPGISASAYEIGEDVYQAFVGRNAACATAFIPLDRPGKYRLDLYALARLRLAAAGVTSVHGGGWCTVGDAERFFSFRRDGPTGRMASLLWIAP